MTAAVETAAAIALVGGVVIVVGWLWANSIERQARLRDRADITPSLPVAICKPTAWRRGRS